MHRKRQQRTLIKSVVVGGGGEGGGKLHFWSSTHCASSFFPIFPPRGLLLPSSCGSTPRPTVRHLTPSGNPSSSSSFSPFVSNFIILHWMVEEGREEERHITFWAVERGSLKYWTRLCVLKIFFFLLLHVRTSLRWLFSLIRPSIERLDTEGKKNSFSTDFFWAETNWQDFSFPHTKKLFNSV